MKYALVNPNWDFAGSTYFGCRDPHYPLELLFAFDKIVEAEHEALLIDAQVENLDIRQVKSKLDAFAPGFLVIPTAPSYLFWRCPPPELRIPMEWTKALDAKVKVVIGPHPSATPLATLRKTGCEFLVLNIIDRESAEHVVRVVPGPILVRVGVSHL